MYGIKELKKLFEDSNEFTQMPPVHPGEILLEEFMKPAGLTAYKLELILKLPRNRITRIVKHKTGLGTDTCLRLAKYFGTTYEFWLNAQRNYEVELLLPNIKSQLDEIPTLNQENTK